jgi:hypothetical protein
MFDDVAIERVPSELADRVRAATANSQYRRIERRGEGYGVSAVAGDRVVVMELAVRADGSVAETTDTSCGLPSSAVATTGNRAGSKFTTRGPSSSGGATRVGGVVGLTAVTRTTGARGHPRRGPKRFPPRSGGPEARERSAKASSTERSSAACSTSLGTQSGKACSHNR